jgi:hypothetical protein
MHNLQRKDRGAIYVMRHACLRVVARQDYLGEILPRFRSSGLRKCDSNHDILVQIDLHNKKIIAMETFTTLRLLTRALPEIVGIR